LQGASKTEIGTDDADFQRWLGRYGMSDAYAKWRAAENKEGAPFLAFVAIACEARILMRLSPQHGGHLARDALLVLQQIEIGPATRQTLAAAQVVKHRLGLWQRFIRTSASQVTEDPTLAFDLHKDPARSIEHDRHHARNALTDFPQFRASSVPFLVKTTRTLGADGLLRLGPPMDMVFALGSARIAARTARGLEYGGVTLPRDECLDVIGTVQKWSTLANRNALIVPGYPGHGKLVRRVLSMALDANTCADLALERTSGDGAAGIDMWEDAEEYHAYALMLFDTNPLHGLSFDQAVAFASAAGRLAERAISDPEIPLPELPDVEEVATPKRVLIYARSMTGGSIAPRRSTATEATTQNALDAKA
jgi:hypothetical protein